MAHVSLKQRLGTVVAAGFLSAALSGSALASDWWWDNSFNWDPIPYEREIPPVDDPTRLIYEKPVGCTELGDGSADYTAPDGSSKTAKPFCTNGGILYMADGTSKYEITENGKTAHYIKYVCENAEFDAFTLQKAVGIFSDCPPNLWCYDGICKAPEKEPGCFDSDSTVLATPESFMAGFIELNPQIKTPGYAKVPNFGFDSTKPESKDNPKFGFEPDHCKANEILYEQSCVTSTAVGVTAAYSSQLKQNPITCPKGTECKTIPITTSNISNSTATGIGAPDKAATCVPKPDTCDPPYTDMCVDIEGCQYTPKECPSKPDVCSSKSEAELKAKYPASTIYPQVTGGWHIDSCASPTQVLHDFCSSGKPDTAITLCPPNTTCANGLCNGQPPPEPGSETQTTDCDDTDITNATNGYGVLGLFGQIKQKSTLNAAANDKCKTTKIVSQAKCDPKKTDGYSFKDFTCPGTQTCKNGVCVMPDQFQNCECSTVDFSPDKIKGKNSTGIAFEKTDYCVGEKIVKVSCSGNTPACFTESEPLFCPNGKTCIAGVCSEKTVAPVGACTELPDGVEYLDSLGQKAVANNYCSDNKVIPKKCGPDLKPVDGAAIICPAGMCAAGKCTNCVDDDANEDILAKGSVTSSSGKGSDFCTQEKKLVQVACKDGGFTELAPQDCPSTMTCVDGTCVNTNVTPPTPSCTSDAACADSDLCTQEACVNGACVAKSATVYPETLCEKFSCDPATGSKISAPKCPADTLCNQGTGACEAPKPETNKSIGEACTGGLQCDDQKICNGVEKCFENKCVAGTAPVEGAASATDTICFDDDKDTITNKKDNCPKLYNPLQEDKNANKTGDVCELVLAAGYSYACATFAGSDGLPNGDLKCWGSNNGGQLGAGKFSDYEWQPQQVLKLPIDPYTPPTEKLTNIRSADGGYAEAQTCATDNQGKVYCWGHNYSGESGLPPSGPFAAASLVPQITNATSVAAGLEHSCALINDGKVMCWGMSGKLGIGGKPGGPTPQWVVDPYSPDGLLGSVASLSSYHFSTGAVLEDGSTRFWGHIDYSTSVPGYISNVLKLAMSYNNGNCYLKKDQTVTCSSWNTNSKPAAISDAIDVAVSDFEKCLVTKTGDVYCWKDDSDWDTPTKNSTISGATQIVAGHDFFCARLKDMSVKCWGSNKYGQLMQPPYGTPTCMLKDPDSGPGCADLDGKKVPSSFLACDYSGKINCSSFISVANMFYTISCPIPAKEGDVPECTKIAPMPDPNDPYGLVISEPAPLLTVGTPEVVKWAKGSSISTLNLSYSTDGGNWTPITSGFDINSYEWTPPPQAIGSSVRLKITGNNNAGSPPKESISQPFQVQGVFTFVSTPSGQLPMGNTFKVVWTKTPTIIDAALFYVKGSDEHLITTTQGNTYDWIVPADPYGSTMTLRIQDVTANHPSAVTNSASFTVKPAVP